MADAAVVVEDHLDTPVLLGGGVDEPLDLHRVGHVGGTQLMFDDRLPDEIQILQLRQ